MLNIISYQKNAKQNTGQNGHHQKISKKINAEEGVEKMETSCTVGGNVNWYSHNGEQHEDSLKT